MTKTKKLAEKPVSNIAGVSSSMGLNNDFILKEDNICPVTQKPCDDECCMPGSTCNISGNDLQEIGDVLSEWVLLLDFDFFGYMIYAGTIFRQVNADYYHPIINGARCPNYQINFMIVKNNPKVFLKLLK
jgi:hypothetical protein